MSDWTLCLWFSQLLDKQMLLPCVVLQQTVSVNGPPQILVLIRFCIASFSSSFRLNLISMVRCLVNGHSVIGTHSWFAEHDPEKENMVSVWDCFRISGE